jgi:outer membrane protein assembly factor BamB
MGRQFILALSMLVPLAADAADGDSPVSAVPAGLTQVDSHESPAVASEQAWAALVEEILSATDARSGFCVVPCCGSKELVAALVRQSDFFAHVLERDETRLRLTRQAIESTGAYGRRASAERGCLSRLPYPDYCANLVVCDFAELPREDACWSEVLRVLRPGGFAYLGQSAETARTSTPISAEGLRAELTAQGVHEFEILKTHGLWARIRRARPAGMGDWTHGRWGTPGNNPCVDDSRVKAPFHTLWISEPNSFTKFGLPLATEGRVLLRHGGITYEGRYKPSQQPDRIQAFDAYNGALLWQQRLEEPEGDGFVALGDLVLAAAGTTLVALDAKDGSVVWRLRAEDVLPGMKSWDQYRLTDDVLVAAVCDTLPQERARTRHTVLLGLSPSDGSILWKLQPAAGIGSFALGGGRCFYASGGELVAIRIDNSREVWRRPIVGSGIVRYFRGVVYTDSASFAGADGMPRRRGSFRGVFVGDRRGRPRVPRASRSILPQDGHPRRVLLHVWPVHHANRLDELLLLQLRRYRHRGPDPQRGISMRELPLQLPHGRHCRKRTGVQLA